MFEVLTNEGGTVTALVIPEDCNEAQLLMRCFVLGAQMASLDNDAELLAFCDRMIVSI